MSAPRRQPHRPTYKSSAAPRPRSMVYRAEFTFDSPLVAFGKWDEYESLRRQALCVSVRCVARTFPKRITDTFTAYPKILSLHWRRQNSSLIVVIMTEAAEYDLGNVAPEEWGSVRTRGEIRRGNNNDATLTLQEDGWQELAPASLATETHWKLVFQINTEITPPSRSTLPKKVPTLPDDAIWFNSHANLWCYCTVKDDTTVTFEVHDLPESEPEVNPELEATDLDFGCLRHAHQFWADVYQEKIVRAITNALRKRYLRQIVKSITRPGSMVSMEIEVPPLRASNADFVQRIDSDLGDSCQILSASPEKQPGLLATFYDKMRTMQRTDVLRALVGDPTISHKPELTPLYKLARRLISGTTAKSIDKSSLLIHQVLETHFHLQSPHGEADWNIWQEAIFEIPESSYTSVMLLPHLSMCKYYLNMFRLSEAHSVLLPTLNWASKITASQDPTTRTLLTSALDGLCSLAISNCKYLRMDDFNPATVLSILRLLNQILALLELLKLNASDLQALRYANVKTQFSGIRFITDLKSSMPTTDIELLACCKSWNRQLFFANLSNTPVLFGVLEKLQAEYNSYVLHPEQFDKKTSFATQVEITVEAYHEATAVQSRLPVRTQWDRLDFENHNHTSMETFERWRHFLTHATYWQLAQCARDLRSFAPHITAALVNAVLGTIESIKLFTLSEMRELGTAVIECITYCDQSNPRTAFSRFWINPKEFLRIHGVVSRLDTERVLSELLTESGWAILQAVLLVTVPSDWHLDDEPAPAETLLNIARSIPHMHSTPHHVKFLHSSLMKDAASKAWLQQSLTDLRRSTIPLDQFWVQVLFDPYADLRLHPALQTDQHNAHMLHAVSYHIFNNPSTHLFTPTTIPLSSNRWLRHPIPITVAEGLQFHLNPLIEHGIYNRLRSDEKGAFVPAALQKRSQLPPCLEDYLVALSHITRHPYHPDDPTATPAIVATMFSSADNFLGRYQELLLPAGMSSFDIKTAYTLTDFTLKINIKAQDMDRSPIVFVCVPKDKTVVAAREMILSKDACTTVIHGKIEPHGAEYRLQWTDAGNPYQEKNTEVFPRQFQVSIKPRQPDSDTLGPALKVTMVNVLNKTYLAADAQFTREELDLTRRFRWDEPKILCEQLTLLLSLLSLKSRNRLPDALNELQHSARQVLNLAKAGTFGVEELAEIDKFNGLLPSAFHPLNLKLARSVVDQSPIIRSADPFLFLVQRLPSFACHIWALLKNRHWVHQNGALSKYIYLYKPRASQRMEQKVAKDATPEAPVQLFPLAHRHTHLRPAPLMRFGNRPSIMEPTPSLNTAEISFLDLIAPAGMLLMRSPTSDGSSQFRALIGAARSCCTSLEVPIPILTELATMTVEELRARVAGWIEGGSSDAEIVRKDIERLSLCNDYDPVVGFVNGLRKNQVLGDNRTLKAIAILFEITIEVRSDLGQLTIFSNTSMRDLKEDDDSSDGNSESAASSVASPSAPSTTATSSGSNLSQATNYVLSPIPHRRKTRGNTAVPSSKSIPEPTMPRHPVLYLALCHHAKQYYYYCYKNR